MARCGVPVQLSTSANHRIRFSNILTSVLGCDGVTCPEPTRFNYKYGIQKEIRDSFDNIIGNASLNKLVLYPKLFNLIERSGSSPG